MLDSTNHQDAPSAPQTLHIVDENLRRGFAQLPRPVLRAKRLSPKAKTLYALLLDYAWQDDSCFPGQGRLAEDLDVSVDTISRALKELKDYQLIDWKQQGLNRPNVYYILRLSDCPNLTLDTPKPPKQGWNPQVADSRNRKLRIQETAVLRNEEYSGDIDPEDVYGETRSITSNSTGLPTSNIRIGTARLTEKDEKNADETVGASVTASLPRGVTTAAGVAVRRYQARQTPEYSHERQVILAYMRDFALEFGDRAPLKSSVTRAYNLFQRSGMDLDGFIASLYEARSVTKERSSAIRGEVGAKNKTPYFFGVLEDVLGLREEQVESAERERRSQTEGDITSAPPRSWKERRAMGKPRERRSILGRYRRVVEEPQHDIDDCDLTSGVVGEVPSPRNQRHSGSPRLNGFS